MGAVLELPKVNSAVDKTWTDQKLLMIGPPKVGKSEFWSHGDRTLYIQTEAGLNHLAVKKLVCHTWGDFRDIYSALVKANVSGKFPYDTIIVDTVDEWVAQANNEIIERGIEKFKAATIYTIGDIPNGAGYSWSRELVRLALKKLEELPAATVLIGHMDTKEIVMENNVRFNMQTIALSPSMGKMICAWADHIMNIEGGNKAGERRVRTRPTGSIMAGSRGDMLPENFVWARNSKENYSNLRKLFT